MKYIFSKIKQLINGIKKLFLEVFIVNRRIRRILKGNICKHYIKPYIKETKYEQKEIKDDFVIYQYWNDDIEKAPDIVKACIKSVQIHENDKKHIILNDKNIEDYVEIPPHIMDLRKKGIIKHAHFSDILRTNLLIQHGGMWIDSTVYLTDKIPKYIIDSDLFVFKNYTEDDLDGLNMASYFIRAKANNKILVDTIDIINNYWKDNYFLVNYFMFLHAFTLSCSKDEINKKMFEDIPFVSFIPVQRFQYELLKKYDENLMNVIKQNSSIHKLSFKEKTLFKKHKNIDLKDTFYEKVIKNEV